MKKLFTYFTILSSASILFFSCEGILDGLNTNLSDDQIASGLREALSVGTDTAVANSSAVDGYFSNALIKIPFPPDANVVLSVVEAVPGGSYLVDVFVEKLNHAAEDAAYKATPIFKDAIAAITFNDAVEILHGADTAATHYLRQQTFTDLYAAFKPEIQSSLESVGAQQAWEDIIDVYNSIPFTSPISTDLADYSTRKGLDGLFILVGDEEMKIRTDIDHRVNDILQEVFGNN